MSPEEPAIDRRQDTIGFPPLPNPMVAESLYAGSLSESLLASLQAFVVKKPRSQSPASSTPMWRRTRNFGAAIEAELVVGWTAPLDPTTPLGRKVAEEVLQSVVAANATHTRFDCDRLVPLDLPLLLRLEENDRRPPFPDLRTPYLTRKLSAIVLVSHTQGAEGGGIGTVPGGEIPLAPGEILVLPSFASWGIAPVTTGRFDLLVFRLHGTTFV